MKTIHFIVNPIAGKGKAIISEQYLSKYFGKKEFSIAVKYSEYKGHAKLLTEQSIVQKVDIIVACGGDGTINEIASSLVNGNIALGIVPIGSGNGLATSLNIPKNLSNALAIIIRGSVHKIDVGNINGVPFFSNTGTGFAANIISNFEYTGKRGFWAYLKAISKSIWFYQNTSNYTLEINSMKKNICPFIIFISNSRVMGYNFSLAHKALLDDGFLDVVVITELNRSKRFYLAFLFLIGKEGLIREFSYHRANNIKLTSKTGNTEIPIQIDGDLKVIPGRVVHIGVLHNGLKVIC